MDGSNSRKLAMLMRLCFFHFIEITELVLCACCCSVFLSVWCRQPTYVLCVSWIFLVWFKYMKKCMNSQVTTPVSSDERIVYYGHQLFPPGTSVQNKLKVRNHRVLVLGSQSSVHVLECVGSRVELLICCRLRVDSVYCWSVHSYATPPLPHSLSRRTLLGL